MEHARVTLHTVCGLEELPGHGARGVTHVLSILDPGWPDPDFGGYGAHRRSVLRFHDAVAPAPGVVVPEPGDVETILAFGRSIAAEAGEAHILVHCHLGLSRSTAALATLFAQAEPETPAEELIVRLHALRDGAWPNARMIGFADDALGRKGTLVDAVRRLHGRQLARNPSLDAVMRDLNRAAEVEAAIRP
ncbi:protein-tyrosine-phosphatase [Methylobacterium sp. C25]|uniref:tyrosine phosphatase family protein n=1 Tax=Methylobacterium sp. C25 TaxID=2721622 RepID=UPI001F1E7D95|nr:protein-tyrosine-phosphatase [Methylobacterium sp. C25]MCE4224821.1 protein-tyrosine-phosphatase [Methylobacterium sp. C25]